MWVGEERTTGERTVALCNNGKMTVLTRFSAYYLFSFSEKLQCEQNKSLEQNEGEQKNSGCLEKLLNFCTQCLVSYEHRL